MAMSYSRDNVQYNHTTVRVILLLYSSILSKCQFSDSIWPNILFISDLVAKIDHEEGTLTLQRDDNLAY